MKIASRGMLGAVLALGLLACGGASTKGEPAQQTPEGEPEGIAGSHGTTRPTTPDSQKPVQDLPTGNFDVKAVVELEEPDDDDSFATRGCLAFDLTAGLSSRNGVWTFSPAVSQAFDSVSLERGAKSFATRPVEAGDSVLDFPAGPCCEVLSFSELQVVNEGSGFRATGQAELTSEGCHGDILYSSSVRVELRGTPDESAPSVALPVETLHPLLPLTLLADEPLARSTSAMLTLSTGRVVTPEATVHAAAPNGAFWGLVVPPLLAFDAVGAWQAEGEDLGGNPLLSTGKLRTMPAPEFLEPDGFEGDVASLGTPVSLSSDALTGERSLYVGEEDVVTFRLETNGGSVLRFDAQVLGSFEDFFEGADVVETVRFRVGVEGGTKVVEKSLPVSIPSGHPKTQPLPLQSVEVPLDETGDAVIVMFDMTPFDEECGLASCDAIPALVDNLRVE